MSTVNHDKEKTDAKLNQLDQLKKFTSIVADTADFESIRQFKPQDATTNPSLVYAVTQKENYSHFLEEVLANRRKSGLSGAAQIDDIIERLLVQFGCAILKIVPGRVSTETDARFSFDVEGSMEKARRLVKLYEEQGIARELKCFCNPQSTRHKPLMYPEPTGLEPATSAVTGRRSNQLS
jgi:transaldolase